MARGILNIIKEVFRKSPEVKLFKRLDAYNGKILPSELSARIEEIRKASDEALKKIKAIGNDIILKRAEAELEALQDWEKNVGELEDARGNKN